MPEPYLVGLDLAGRRVVVVGGGHGGAAPGHRAARRGRRRRGGRPGGHARRSRRWRPRASCAGPPASTATATSTAAWYAIACTDDPAVNAAVGAEAERARVFCVRADDAPAGQRGHPRRRPARRADRRGARRPGAPPLGRGAHRAGGGAADRVWCDDTAEPVRPGVALVGGGPGDPELITVRGRRLLARADVVVTDRLGPRDLLDQLGPHVEVIDASKIPYGRAMNQARINELLIDARAGGPVRGAAQGRRPVRLRPRLRGGAGLRRGRRPGHRGARRDQRVRRARRGRRAGHATAAWRTRSSWCPGTSPPGDPRSLVDWAAARQAARHASCC